MRAELRAADVAADQRRPTRDWLPAEGGRRRLVGMAGLGGHRDPQPDPTLQRRHPAVALSGGQPFEGDRKSVRLAPLAVLDKYCEHTQKYRRFNR